MIMLKFSKKIAFIIIAIAVVAGVAGYLALRGPQTVYETDVVSRGSVVETISVTGSIAPGSKISLQPEASGRVAKILVAEGDHVQAGDALIKIDSRDIETRISSQRAVLASAQAQLREFLAGATAEDLRVSESAVETASAQLAAAEAAKIDAEIAKTNAQRNLENTQAKGATLIESKISTLLLDFDDAVTASSDAVNRLSMPLFTTTDQLSFSSSNSQAESDAVSSRRLAKDALAPLAAAAASARSVGTLAAVKDSYAIIQAKLQVVKAHIDAAAAVLNYSLGLSSTTLATYQLNINTAQNTLNTIISTLSTDRSSLDLQQRLNASDETAASIALANSETALNAAASSIETSLRAKAQAQAAYDLKKIGTRPETIDVQRARVAAESAALDGLLNELTKRTVIAPIEAVVTDIAVELGETVTQNQVVITLNSKGAFEILSNISEVDIARVTVGDPVTITLDAFSTGEKWTGKVITIQPAEKVVEGVIFYETKIVFDQEDPRLKSGMTANLDIEVARHDGVLRIPLRALKENGRKYVQVLVNGVPAEKDVAVGLESNDFVEITSGLTEGETVVIAANGKK
jgi:HlyD family secretion protein